MFAILGLYKIHNLKKYYLLYLLFEAQETYFNEDSVEILTNSPEMPEVAVVHSPTLPLHLQGLGCKKGCGLNLNFELV